jgi:hypothetical protein
MSVIVGFADAMRASLALYRVPRNSLRESPAVRLWNIWFPIWNVWFQITPNRHSPTLQKTDRRTRKYGVAQHTPQAEFVEIYRLSEMTLVGLQPAK